MTRGMAVKVLAALVALQLLMSGVALATFEEEPGQAELGIGGSSPTTSSPGAEVVPGAPGSDAPADPGVAPPAGADGGAPAASPPPAAGTGTDLNSLPERPGPPRTGTYRYRNKGKGNASFGTFTTQIDEDGESSVRYESAGAGPGESRDRQRQEGSGSRDSFNFSGSGTEERSWRADGMYITVEKASAEGRDQEGGQENFNLDCDWNPDLRQLAFPLKEGQSWKWDSSCESKEGDNEYRRRNQGSGKVVGTRTASVGGKEVRVLILEVRSVEDVFVAMTRNGNRFESTSHIEQDERISYASSVALPIRVESRVRGTTESPQAPGQQGRFEGEGTSELISLDPK
jgi:hypothetical protein